MKILITERIVEFEKYNFYISLLEDFENNKENLFSLPRYIKDNNLKLRKKYLDWVEAVGSTGAKTSLKEFLVRDGFSFWWSNHINEKCNFSKSEYIDSAIQALALKEIISKTEIKNIFLDFNSLDLFLALKDLLKNENTRIHLLNNKISIQSMGRLVKDYTYILFMPIFGIFSSIFYCFQWWGLKKADTKSWEDYDSDLAFVSYFASFDKNSFSENTFKSNYWGSLPEILESDGVRSKWIHIWLKSNQFKDNISSVEFVNKLNENNENHSKHLILNSLISIKILLRTIFTLLCNTPKILRIFSLVRETWNLENNLWSVHRKDFFDSILGKSAAYNFLLFLLFEKAFHLSSKSSSLVYLQENQSWEIGLIKAFKENSSNKKVFGLPHTTIRFWDLRFSRIYHSFPKSISPDFILSNGSKTRFELQQNGVSRERIIDVEALRYEYLYKNIDKYKEKRNLKEIKILSIGEYEREGTQYQLDMLEQALKIIKSDGIKFTVSLKPHPSTPIDVSKYKSLNVKIRNESLEELMNEFNLAVSSGQTTASVDLYCFGMPVITCINNENLNLNPLEGLPSNISVSSPKELSRSIIDIIQQKERLVVDRNYFNLSLDFHKWKTFLEENIHKK